MLSINKMAGARSWCGGFQDKSFAFQDWKYADKRHKWKEKVQKNAQFPFCGQTKAFRYEIVSRGIQPCFLHGGSERLACFEPTKAARFLKTLEVHSVLYDQRRVFVFKKNFWIYKGFMDVFYILTSAWKKNHKMCIWKFFFAMCSTDLTCVNATI